MNIKPLGNRVLIKVVKNENKTKSGLILTYDEEGSENFGIVVEISKDLEKLDILKKGNKVVFDKEKAAVIKKDNENLYISNLENIYAIVGD